MTSRKKQWVYAPDKRKTPKSKVPADKKSAIKTRADTEVVPTLRTRYIKPPPEDAQFNYIEAIDTKWYRHYFYFFATYCVPGPNALVPSFDSNIARLEYLAEDHFNLSYQRHNDQWMTLYSGLSLDECFEAVLNDPWFQG